MIFIDANVFLAYDNKDDVHHNLAHQLFQEIEQGKYGHYFTSDYVFNEVVGVTFRKLGKERASIVGKMIIDAISLVNIDDHLLKQAWNFFLENDSKLNLVDCTNIIICKITKAENIATFDKEFSKVKELKVVNG